MAFAAELFTYLLFYLYFALTSIENQQYLNFKKQTEKILARFCKNTNGKHIEPKTTMFCLSFILFCKNILFISVEDHIIMRTKEKKIPTEIMQVSNIYNIFILLKEINDAM